MRHFSVSNLLRLLCLNLLIAGSTGIVCAGEAVGNPGGSESSENSLLAAYALLEEVPDEIQQFRLEDGSIVSVNYETAKISVQLGVRGPKIDEEFTEGDFGGIFWDWGQIVPQEDGTWYYEDWLDEGYESAATPLSPSVDLS